MADIEDTAEGDRREQAERLKAAGRELGFDVLRIAPAVSPTGYHPLLEWIANGYAADMEWIARRQSAYQHPDGILPNTRSVIMVAMNYRHAEPEPGTARISRYAWGSEDYHSVLRRKLKTLAAGLNERCPEARTRVVVDTAPLLERDFARLAGIGWFGKNTMLISRDIGSWIFLGALLTTESLTFDEPFVGDYCGTCTRCLDTCPTGAFPAPHVLDANRCISYLTIERRDKSVPNELRHGIGDWVFGCDICQEVCPWNRFAPTDTIPEFRRRHELQYLDVVDLLSLDDAAFQCRFGGTPLERTGRNVIVRNAAIVAANQHRTDTLAILNELRNDSSELVAEAARWAVKELTQSQRR
ncbi:MAG: tRNA epoxyqueuosine(34) reductase QueG [Planctomycetaceae bacterium]